MSTSRRKPYYFISVKDGRKEQRIFYAPDNQTAINYAQAWGKRTRHKMYRKVKKKKRSR